MEKTESVIRKRLWLTIATLAVLGVLFYVLNAVIAKPQLTGEGSVALTGNEHLVYYQDSNDTDPGRDYWGVTAFAPSVPDESVFAGYAQERVLYSPNYENNIIMLMEEYRDGISDVDYFNFGENSGIGLYVNVDGELQSIEMPEGYTGTPWLTMSPDQKYISVDSGAGAQWWVLNLETGEWSDEAFKLLPQGVYDFMTNHPYDPRYAMNIGWHQDFDHVLRYEIGVNDDGTYAHVRGHVNTTEFFVDVEVLELVDYAVIAAAEEQAYEESKNTVREEQFRCADEEQSLVWRLLFERGGWCTHDYNNRYDFAVKRRLFGKQQVSIVDTETDEEFEVASWYAFMYPQKVSPLFLSDDGMVLLKIDDTLYVADPHAGTIEHLMDLPSQLILENIPFVGILPAADIPYLSQE